MAGQERSGTGGKGYSRRLLFANGAISILSIRKPLAQATFAAAVERWPGAKITLRNGTRIIDKTWPADD
jgi:hypothetical protein